MKEEMILKIQAALEAWRDSDLVIMTRTDARKDYGLDEAISRVRHCVRAGSRYDFY
jgi:2-methylisocitrate lyase-like PEP mutase family enzyme